MQLRTIDVQIVGYLPPKFPVGRPIPVQRMCDTPHLGPRFYSGDDFVAKLGCARRRHGVRGIRGGTVHARSSTLGLPRARRRW